MSGAARKFNLAKEQEAQHDVALPRLNQAALSQLDGPPADAPAGGPAVGFASDPARDPARDAALHPPAVTDMVRNLDIPASAFSSDNATNKARLLAKRPGYNMSGKEVTIGINCFPITKFPTKPIYQYDVLIGNGAEKRIVNQKVWGARSVKEKYPKFIYDGSRLAWSLASFPNETSLVVDLDAEQGRPGRDSNSFKITVKPTKVVNLQAVVEYACNQNTSLLLDMLEGLNALDHLVRETPTARFISIKRSFFSTENAKMDLGGGATAYKGIYQAIRVVHPGRLTVSVDVSNSCFWGMNSLIVLATSILKLKDVQELIAKTKAREGSRSPTKSFESLNRLNKLVVKANYKGCPCPDKEWKIKNLILADAKEYKIEITDKATGETKSISVFDYFKSRYNLTLNYWQLPLVQMTKRGVIYPMEVLAVYSPQRYPFKLDEMQTATMIKFAVTRPSQRLGAITQSKRALSHSSDPVLKAFGMEISETMQKTKGRLLANPSVCFGGNQKANPGTTGRWDLRGKKFFAPNHEPLVSWGVVSFKGPRSANRAQIEAFVAAFVKQYSGHGGKVANKNPFVMESGPDPAKAAFDLYQNTGNKFNKRPQLLIFIVNSRDSIHYQRIKKSCDCRFGVPSQVVQGMQVQKCAPQYISNVLMKVNAKLGGTTAVANGTANIRPYTMIIGADVSHAAPGMMTPSTAAMTVSMDRLGAQFAGAAQTNGRHVEMITPDNVEHMLAPIVKKWTKDIGQGKPPQYVYYFRDGVSEGQFQQVMDTEVQYIRQVLRHANNGNPWNGKITVVVASKRHHIRGFPDANDRNASDKNQNCVPGVIVEKDVTDPHGFDFFLWSHTALQGTSRPVHYHVLLDEQAHPPHILQNMIYEHCYQYMRSTTSVSIYPAIYYAHLVSNRAKCHENVPSSSGPGEGGPSVAGSEQVAPLMPVDARDNLPFRMWYI